MAYVAIGGGTVADIAGGNLANYMPIIWAKKTLDFAEKQLVVWKTFDNSYEGELSGGGDTIRINPLLEITAAAVNTSADPSAYDTDQGAYTDLVINQWYEAVVGINDFQSLLGSPDYETRVIPKLGYAIAKAIDTYAAGFINGLTGGVGTEGEAVTFDTLLLAKAYLDTADVPEDNRVLMIDPETLSDLLQDDMFTSSLYGASGAVAKGFIGQTKVLNCSVYVSNNLEVVNTYYHGAGMYHREAVAVAMRQDIKYDTWRKEERHTTFHRAAAIYGAVQARGTFGVFIKTRS
jgi:hypothetical protein